MQILFQNTLKSVLPHCVLTAIISAATLPVMSGVVDPRYHECHNKMNYH